MNWSFNWIGFEFAWRMLFQNIRFGFMDSNIKMCTRGVKAAAADSWFWVKAKTSGSLNWKRFSK